MFRSFFPMTASAKLTVPVTGQDLAGACFLRGHLSKVVFENVQKVKKIIGAYTNNFFLLIAEFTFK